MKDLNNVKKKYSKIKNNVKKKRSKIRSKDKVVVIAGIDKGKIAEVEKVNLKKWKLRMPNICMVKKHKKKTKDQAGSIIMLPRYVDISNVMYYCSNCKKGVRVAILRENSKKIRQCKSCKRNLDKI